MHPNKRTGRPEEKVKKKITSGSRWPFLTDLYGKKTRIDHCFGMVKLLTTPNTIDRYGQSRSRRVGCQSSDAQRPHCIGSGLKWLLVASLVCTMHTG